MNTRETMRYVMFGGAAALFVAGGLMVGQMMGAQPLQHVQAAAFQPFDYVTEKADEPKNDAAEGEGVEPTATATDVPADQQSGAAESTSQPTASSSTSGGGSTGAPPAPQTATPTTEPAQEPPAPASEEPTEVPLDPTEEPVEPEAPEPEDEPDGPAPEPDPEEPGGDDGMVVIPIDPCLLFPDKPECDDEVKPPFELHPCTWTDEPCPGEEPEEPELEALPVNPCLIIECEEPEGPEVQLDVPLQVVPLKPTPEAQFNPPLKIVLP